MTTAGSKRKTSKEFAVEHEVFLGMVKERFPKLEIEKTLGLSTVQAKTHMLRALTQGEVTADELIPNYQLVHIKSLPPVVREMLPNPPDGETEPLVRAVDQGGEVLLSLFTFPPKQESTETSSCAQPAESAVAFE